MQTFLPYPNYARSAYVLDRARLGKQRVEVLQILRTLSGDSPHWKNHPAVKMWRGHENQLIGYGIAICHEWRRRGYKDTCLEKIIEYSNRFGTSLANPSWLGDPSFHTSHQSNLIRKDPTYYREKFGHHLTSTLPYVWPT